MPDTQFWTSWRTKVSQTKQTFYNLISKSSKNLRHNLPSDNENYFLQTWHRNRSSIDVAVYNLTAQGAPYCGDVCYPRSVFDSGKARRSESANVLHQSSAPSSWQGCGQRQRQHTGARVLLHSSSTIPSDRRDAVKVLYNNMAQTLRCARRCKLLPST